MRVSIVFLASGFSPQGVDEKEREHHRSYHGSRRIHFFFCEFCIFFPRSSGGCWGSRKAQNVRSPCGGFAGFDDTLLANRGGGDIYIAFGEGRVTAHDVEGRVDLQLQQIVSHTTVNPIISPH